MLDCNKVVTGAFSQGPTSPSSCNVRQKSWTKSYSSRLLVYRTSSWKSFSKFFSRGCLWLFLFDLLHYSLVLLLVFFLLVTVNVKSEEAKKSSCEPKTSMMCHPSSFFFFSLKHKILTFLCTKSLKHSKKSALEVLVKWPLDCLDEKQLGEGGGRRGSVEKAGHGVPPKTGEEGSWV